MKLTQNIDMDIKNRWNEADTNNSRRSQNVWNENDTERNVKTKIRWKECDTEKTESMGNQ